MSLIYRDISFGYYGKNLNEHLIRFQIEKHKNPYNALCTSMLQQKNLKLTHRY